MASIVKPDLKKKDSKAAKPKTTTVATTVKKTYPVKKRGKLIVKARVQQLIEYWNRVVPHGLEWSSILIFTHNGKSHLSEDFEVYAEDLIFMDIGTPSYTGYELSQEVGPDEIVTPFNNWVAENQDFVIENAECFGSGMHHSHHNMKTFFSGTDNSELMDNAKFYEETFYVSLITNNSYNRQYTAKIAFTADVKSFYKGMEINTKKQIQTVELDVVCEETPFIQDIEERLISEETRVLKAVTHRKSKQKVVTTYPRSYTAGTPVTGTAKATSKKYGKYYKDKFDAKTAKASKPGDFKKRNEEALAKATAYTDKLISADEDLIYDEDFVWVNDDAEFENESFTD